MININECALERNFLSLCTLCCNSFIHWLDTVRPTAYRKRVSECMIVTTFFACVIVKMCAVTVFASHLFCVCVRIGS